MLPDHRVESGVCRSPVTADLASEGERVVFGDDISDLMLCGIERGLRVAALDLNGRELQMVVRRRGLQLDGPADRPLGLIKAVQTREISGEVVVRVGPQRF